MLLAVNDSCKVMNQQVLAPIMSQQSGGWRPMSLTAGETERKVGQRLRLGNFTKESLNKFQSGFIVSALSCS